MSRDAQHPGHHLLPLVLTVLFSFSACTPAIAGGKLGKAAAQAALRDARAAWSIRSQGAPPFDLVAEITLPREGKKQSRGSWTLAWIDHTHWREEMTFRGFRDVQVSRGRELTWLRKPDRYLQLVADIQDALRAERHLALPDHQTIIGAKRVKRHGRQLWRLRTGHAAETPKPAWTIYLDAATGELALLEGTTNYTSYLYEGSLEVGERRWPRTITVLHEERVAASIAVRIAERDRLQDETALEPPEGSRIGIPQDSEQCQHLKGLVPLRSTRARIPGSFGLQGADAHVRWRALISKEGETQDVVVEWASHPSLVEPFVESLRSMRYRPAKCEGEPVAVILSGVQSYERPRR